MDLILVHLQLFPPVIPYPSFIFSVTFTRTTHFASFLESSTPRLQSLTKPLSLENSRWFCYRKMEMVVNTVCKVTETHSILAWALGSACVLRSSISNRWVNKRTCFGREWRDQVTCLRLYSWTMLEFLPESRSSCFIQFSRFYTTQLLVICITFANL